MHWQIIQLERVFVGKLKRDLYTPTFFNLILDQKIQVQYVWGKSIIWSDKCDDALEYESWEDPGVQ